MKRITMGGAETVVTDDAVADLVLEYAKELGRVGQTDTVTIPSVLRGRAVPAGMLLGPASQIVLLPDVDDGNASTELRDLQEIRRQLRYKIDVVCGRTGVPETDSMQLFPNFDEFDLGVDG